MIDDFPTKNRKRAKRRFMKQKMKQKARKIAKYVFGWGKSKWSTEEDINWFACHAADNLKLCSCEMCRNPRRNGEKTIQEKKFEESFREQLND